jgi:hypothetical protein
MVIEEALALETVTAFVLVVVSTTVQTKLELLVNAGDRPVTVAVLGEADDSATLP